MKKAIAIVGMSCRFPGADRTEMFWENLIKGLDVITNLTDQELMAEGISDEFYRQTNYVKRCGIIDNVDMFDAEFFEYAPKEAALIDPQARILLELTWEALESSGCAGEIVDKSVGVFASTSINRYLLNNILSNKQRFKNKFQEVIIANAPDCLATRISYKLGLRGPSVTIQCGCSSSLVSLHHARIALLTQQCDIAIVSAASISLPQKVGYLYHPDGFLSHDGLCRPFSDDADGTLFTSGAAVIVLKRYDDAYKAGNPVHAIVKGSAINNDGKDKAGFTAPSVSGQTEVIVKAQRVSGIEPETINYVEAHGTATPIGDPIEVEALTKAFRLTTTKKQFCALGSVKSNIGHIDVAAGLAGLIKTTLVLKNGIIPASLHYQKPNPRIDFSNSPFYVCHYNQEWPKHDHPRRAAVSSFGFGGTNAHVILEQAPRSKMVVNKRAQLFVFSAKHETTLVTIATQLACFLANKPEVELSDVAYTLQLGRLAFKYRCGFICNSLTDAIDQLNFFVKQTNHGKQEYSEVESNSELNTCLRLWLAGKDPNFALLHKDIKPNIIELPTYPFERKRYWIDACNEDAAQETANKLVRLNDHHQWVFTTAWQQSRWSTIKMNHCRILCFVKKNSDILSAIEASGKDVIKVYAGKSFEIHRDGTFSIDVKDKSHYLCLIKYLKEKARLFDHIVHTFSLSELESLDIGFNSVLNLMQALLAIDNKLCKKLDVVTWASCAVLGDEKLLPANAMLHALTRVIQQEYAHIRSRCIDITNLSSENLNFLTRELYSDSKDDLVALRGKSRWLQSYQLIKLDQSNTESLFVKNGVYLITGGLGNVGLVYAEFLAKYYQAALVLVGRSEFPAESEWDAIVARNLSSQRNLINKIEKLKRIKNFGSKVLLQRGDITDYAQMQQIIQNVASHFGKLVGIIHCAGAKGELHYKPIAEINDSYTKQVFDPKIKGIDVIQLLSEQYRVELCVIISSISSILAGLGLCVYSASHNYINSFVQLCNSKSSCKWYAINWDAWNFHISADQANQQQIGGFGSEIDKFTISAEQGQKVLLDLSKVDVATEYTVSTCDLALRHRYWVKKDFFKKKVDLKGTMQPRPNLSHPYIKPNNNIQEAMLKIWSDLLGIEQIGIKDSFFELGGHSLLALEMVSDFNKKFNEEISIVDLFDNPTIEKLSQLFANDDSARALFDRVQSRAQKQRQMILHKTKVKIER